MSDNVYSVEFEEERGRQKVTLPLRLKWGYFALYTISLLVWAGMVLVILVYLIRGLSSSVVLTILLLLWLLVWLGFGRFLWTRWQYQAANREILFIDSEQLIVRRPVSLLGITTAYDMDHASPFYYNEEHHCPAFDYGFLHIYFGQDLPRLQAHELVSELNERWFPDAGGAED